MSKELRVLTFALATLAVITLIWLTHETMRLSSWIVYSDHVWEEMDRVGAGHEHNFAEGMHSLRHSGFIYVEAVVGIAFLALLWRLTLTGPRANGTV
jgi:hypothetical protein